MPRHKILGDLSQMTSSSCTIPIEGMTMEDRRIFWRKELVTRILPPAMRTTLARTEILRRTVNLERIPLPLRFRGSLGVSR